MTTAPAGSATAEQTARVEELKAILDAGAVRSVYQPIVELDTGRVAAYEALARGPEGPLAGPADLFEAARHGGMLARLDEACRAAAFRGAVQHGLVAPLTLFVNVEPEVLDRAPLEDLLELAENAPGHLRVVLEITERALATRPAELLRTVERVRQLGWGVALDDVGADPASLAFMSLLRPDVVKLDLSLVQQRPTAGIAEIMNAVNAYAQRAGALVLAEGIETEHHLMMALALGATLGQGWLFGRPTAAPDPGPVARPLRLLDPVATTTYRPEGCSPFASLPPGTALRQAPKRLLVELSKQIEREAMRIGETAILASTFQHRRHFTALTAERYRELVRRTGFVCALGEDLPDGLLPGLRGGPLAADDPVLGEWDVVVVSPHFSTALLARDLGDTGPEMDRMFEYALTYDRHVAVDAAHHLLARVSAEEVPADPAAAGVTLVRIEDNLIDRALAAATSGVTIADMTHPDQPLIYVNAAFEALAGFRREDLLRGNCRFLQGPDTDPAAVARVRAAIDAGVEIRETLLNYRGPDRLPWWNELHLAPVTDRSGRLVQYIGVQTDVSARVLAEQGLVQERDRAHRYLTRIEQLAYTDPLTGLMNRRRFEERVEAELWEAHAGDSSLALLFMDLDGFKTVNDSLGHSAGDELLVQVARRLEAGVRRSDLLARFGGDEFLVVVTGLDPDGARGRAQEIADGLAAALREPLQVAGQEVVVSASIGLSTYPQDGEDFGRLLHAADLRMYQLKHPRP
ncbi:diguanylate cyclase domain-containing protein [Nocardioides mesophilus]|uniref:Diguanylate cyclase n=1 Tax=Nocardioides mesophilus TaxID=433659 RepID=A0A7G9RBY5_9ACTN|nr:diguanylate cyclase [Nocardioides mesophilus]QNN53110.1 diguanylate cyclase [Nocardioides mesophilus]